MLLKEISNKRIKISNKWLVLLAYFYMILPIIIFFIGMLKIYWGILFSVILIFGFYHLMKTRENAEDDYFILSYKTFLIIILAVGIWVFLSGIGGYFYQRWDWHGRNAVLRDLIQYSWPVIYPETENALVYYFAFWMVPALVGKVFGWNAANFVLYIWSCLGIIISLLLLFKILNTDTRKKIFAIISIFIFWGGLNIIGQAIVNVIGYGGFPLGSYFGWPDKLTGYQYTPNNGLIEWVFNQTIVPWIAVLLFLQDKRISVLAFLGLCVLPFAPLPFCGLFIIFVFWALPWVLLRILYKEWKKLYFEIFSIPNICAIFSIFLVFLLFFSCNTATNGSAGKGGIGFYIKPENFNIKVIFTLILFYILEFLVYSILIYHENKKNLLFYIVNISLLIIPFFRIGSGRDFCMRASIPALFLLMVMVMDYLIKRERKELSVRVVFLIVSLTIASLSTIFDWMAGLKQIIQTNTYPIYADNLYTFCDKNPTDLSDDTNLINFVTEKPTQKLFYKVLAKKKDENSKKNDLSVALKYREEHNFVLSGGIYLISPYNCDLYLSCDGTEINFSDKKSEIMLSAIDKEYQMIFREYAKAVDIPKGKIDESGTVSIWNINSSIAQKWKIEEINGYYLILFQDHALTYDRSSNSVYLSLRDENENQFWKISKP